MGLDALPLHQPGPLWGEPGPWVPWMRAPCIPAPARGARRCQPDCPAPVSDPPAGRRPGAYLTAPLSPARSTRSSAELSRNHGVAAGRGHGDAHQRLPSLLGQRGGQVQAEQEGAEGAAAERAGLLPGDPEGHGCRGEDHAGPG